MLRETIGLQVAAVLLRRADSASEARADYSGRGLHDEDVTCIDQLLLLLVHVNLPDIKLAQRVSIFSLHARKKSFS